MRLWYDFSPLLHFLPCPYTHSALSQATALDILGVLIPPITFSINTTDCLCASVEELADRIHSPLEHDCVPKDDCSGVRCTLEVIVATYYLDAVILSCNQPPGVEIDLEDSDGNLLYTRIFNQTEVTNIPIAGFSVPLSFSIVHRNYSMDIEVSRFYSDTLMHINITCIPLCTCT